MYYGRSGWLRRLRFINQQELQISEEQVALFCRHEYAYGIVFHSFRFIKILFVVTV
jgi:hypothetical protein